eukprot:5986660-Pyramimonas_sp.AAC.2
MLVPPAQSFCLAADAKNVLSGASRRTCGMWGVGQMLIVNCCSNSERGGSDMTVPMKRADAPQTTHEDVSHILRRTCSGPTEDVSSSSSLFPPPSSHELFWVFWLALPWTGPMWSDYVSCGLVRYGAICSRMVGSDMA